MGGTPRDCDLLLVIVVGEHRCGAVLQFIFLLGFPVISFYEWDAIMDEDQDSASVYSFDVFVFTTEVIRQCIVLANLLLVTLDSTITAT